MNKIWIILVLSFFLTQVALGEKFQGQDLFIPAYTKAQIDNNVFASNQNYTVLQHGNTQQWDTDISRVIAMLQHSPQASVTEKIKLILNYFNNRPYNSAGNTEGESNWPVSSTSNATAHVKQDPIYQTEMFDCQTLVQTILALLHSTSLKDFQHTIIAVEYRASNDPIHYYNRYNFVSADMNPVNEKLGYLKDSTAVKYQVKALIDKDNWFDFQAKNLQSAVSVFPETDANAMVERFQHYATAHPFRKSWVKLNYFHKQDLVNCKEEQGKATDCHTNVSNVMALPTPAVVEITRDASKWTIGGKPIADVIGTQLNVSHLGVLYDQNFKTGQTEYQKIQCHYNDQQQKTCVVIPVICQSDSCVCREKMYAASTDAYPSGYYYYQDKQGYHCSSTEPSSIKKPVYCNRVTAMPIGDYLASYQYGSYVYMDSPSIVGIHLEQIL